MIESDRVFTYFTAFYQKIFHFTGSEKVKDTNTSGDQLLETNNINKSLLVLGEGVLKHFHKFSYVACQGLSAVRIY